MTGCITVPYIQGDLRQEKEYFDVVFTIFYKGFSYLRQGIDNTQKLPIPLTKPCLIASKMCSTSQRQLILNYWRVGGRTAVHDEFFFFIRTK